MKDHDFHKKKKYVEGERYGQGRVRRSRREKRSFFGCISFPTTSRQGHATQMRQELGSRLCVLSGMLAPGDLLQSLDILKGAEALPSMPTPVVEKPTSTPGSDLTCSLCGRTFGQIWSLFQHTGAKHPQEAAPFPMG